MQLCSNNNGKLSQNDHRKINPEARIVLDNDRLCPEKGSWNGCLVIIKIQNLTNWRPKFSLESGIDETINWYRAHPEFQTKSLSYNI